MHSVRDRCPIGQGTQALTATHEASTAQLIHTCLAGQSHLEPEVIRVLRQVGEAAARRQGLQSGDVDAAGIDFAAYLLVRLSHLSTVPDLAIPAYLRTSARRFVAREAARLSQECLPLVSETVLGQLDPWEDMVATRLLAGEIGAAADTLPEAERHLYSVCLVEGHDCAEAAALLGCSHVAARKRLERLKRRLRSLLVPPSKLKDRRF